MIGKPIFFDPTGKRGRLLRGLAWAMGTLSAIVFFMFAVTLIVVHQKGLARLTDATVAAIEARSRAEERQARYAIYRVVR